jgi:hypothetical protein
MTGLGGDEAILAQKLTDADLRQLKKMEPNQARSFLFEKGIADIEGGAAGDERLRKITSGLVGARLRANLQLGPGGLAQGYDVEAMAQKFERGEQPNRKEQFLFNKGAGFMDFGSGSEAQRASTAIISNEPNTAAKEATAARMKGEGGTEQQKMLDDMRTQGFKQLSQAALEATSSFKTAADALRALGSLAKEVENIGDTGGEGKFKTAAADAAGTFGKSTIQFEKSVSEFSKTVNALMNKSGLDSDPKKSGMDIIQKNERRGSKL